MYYCTENPVVYRSEYFVKFFEQDNSSPTEETTSPIDGDEKDGVMESSLDDASIDLTSLNNSIEEEDQVASQNGVSKDTELPEENSFEYLSTGFDYLYDAAMCFSQAVQEEANLRYKPAFELYKMGIDKLLTGAKSDVNERRKRIAKTKAGKYLERAEILYENHIVKLQEETFIFEDSKSTEDATSILALERPANNLSRFKVISINNYMMRVQDCTDKKFYILKKIYKDVHSAILLPQSIPFMVRLISYYNTENSFFLLLPLMSGGLLWNYINSYTNKTLVQCSNLEEIFVDPPDLVKSSISSGEPVDGSTEIITEDVEVEVAEEPREDNFDLVDNYSNEPVAIPSFDTLSSEMDINDLMSCSQKLLLSVSKTLEKSQIRSQEKPSTNKDSFRNLEQETEAHVECARVPESTVIEPKEIIPIFPRQTESFPENIIKQWASELIVAVNNLHKAGIICGDLNLDNLLLGPSGHLNLTFFHQSNRNHFQQLCCLNPKAMKFLYVAFDFPLTKESDWYSVGVLIYELLTRDRFYVYHPVGVSRFNEVQYQDPDEISEDAKDLLHGLIIEKAENRLKYNDLISHPFFNSISFEEVERCGLEFFKN